MQRTEIIQQLSTEQKIAVAADVGALKLLQGVQGIPNVRIAKIDKLVAATDREFPTYSALAYTWNDKLIEKAFACEAQDARVSGVRAIMAPHAGVKSTPLSKGNSEDPYIDATTIGAYIRALTSEGITPCVGGGLEEQDVAYMDKEFSKRAFYEYYMEPFNRSKASAYVYPYKQLKGNYATVNTEKISGYFHDEAHRHDGFVLCTHCPADKTVQALNDGNLLIKGDAESLRRAVNRFIAIEKKVENGELDYAALEDALDSGTAFSLQQLDGVVGKVLEFAFLADERQIASKLHGDESETAYAAAEQSIVLMKNDGKLPLKGITKIAVVGNAENSVFLDSVSEVFQNTCKQRCKIYGAVGYSLSSAGADGYGEQAIALAKNCDAVVVLLEQPKGNKSHPYRLPANQLALMDALKKTQRTVVGVLCGEQPVDVGFDDCVNGLLLTPSVTGRTAEALVNILIGKACPSGKLINTYYTDGEKHFKAIADNKKLGTTKVGTFVGYREYDSTGLVVKYPFGHGLSYAKFAYSNLLVTGNTFSFTVKNEGNVSAAEVVQIYVGKKDSSVVRPKKQLKGFVKITLAAGESKTVRGEINPRTLAVYHGGKFVVEGGRYEMFVGSSLNDIRLKGSLVISGDMIKKSGERRSDYLQSHTNLVSGGYTMTPVKKKTRTGIALRVFGGCLMAIVGVIALLLSLLQMARGINVLVSPLFEILIIGLPAICGVGLLLFIVGGIKNKKAKKKEAVLSTGKAHETQNKQKRQTYRNLFDALYAEEEEEVVEEKQELQTKIVQEEFIGRYDSTITFAAVCEELAKYITARGINADMAFARKVLASFSSSRILILRANDKELSYKLLQILSEYFGGETYRQNLVEAQTFADVLYMQDGSATTVGNAMEHSEENKDTIQIAALDFTDIEQAAGLCTQLTKFASRRTKGQLFVYTNGKTQKPVLYPNLWFVLCADEKTNIVSSNLPFNDAACVLQLPLEACEETEVPIVHILNYYQLYKMETTALRFDGKYAERNLLDEDKFWKKLDKFEQYLSSEAEYAFHNRLGASMERYATVFLACEGEQDAALDNVVASKLVLTAIGLLGAEKALEEGGLMAHVDTVLADDTAEETKRIINTCVMNIEEAEAAKAAEAAAAEAAAAEIAATESAEETLEAVEETVEEAVEEVAVEEIPVEEAVEEAVEEEAVEEVAVEEQAEPETEQEA